MSDFNPNDWIECSKIWVPDHDPDQFNIYKVGKERVVYFYAAYPDGHQKAKEPNVGVHDQWTTVDVSTYVPLDAKAVFLSGVLIITHGKQRETADLQVFYRRDDTQPNKGGNYVHQVVLNRGSEGNGQRCCASVIVPLTAQKTFQWKWKVPNGHVFQHDEYSAYGCNLRIGAVFA